MRNRQRDVLTFLNYCAAYYFHQHQKVFVTFSANEGKQHILSPGISTPTERIVFFFYSTIILAGWLISVEHLQDLMSTVYIRATEESSQCFCLIQPNVTFPADRKKKLKMEETSAEAIEEDPLFQKSVHTKQSNNNMDTNRIEPRDLPSIMGRARTAQQHKCCMARERGHRAARALLQYVNPEAPESSG